MDRHCTMTERVKRKIGRWVAGVLGALLMPLALAQPPHGGHGFGGHGFGGGDMRDAYITLLRSGRLVKVRWDEPGLKLHFG